MTRLRRLLLPGFAALVFVYLLLPVAIVIPLSFSAGKFLTFPPPGFSLQWYQNFFGRAEWTGSAWISIWVALSVTLLSVLLGTPAALALARVEFPGKRLMLAFLLSPIIAPGIIVAIGVYFAYARYGMVGHPAALVVAHTCLAVPFVVINVTAALQGVDRRLEQAAQTLGATPFGAFRQVTLPLIRPGIFAGAVFAFITSFDELLVALYLSGSTAVTLPRRMWEQMHFNLDPTIAAVSTMLILVTTTLMLGAELLRRRAERRRSMPVAAIA